MLPRALALLDTSVQAAQRLLAKFRDKRDTRRSSATCDVRRKECGRVIRTFLRSHGHVAPSIASKQEIRDLIDEGIEPSRLRQLLLERARRTPGILLGHQQVGHQLTPVVLPRHLRLRHVLVVGATGVGKTTLQRHMVRSDMESSEGLAVIAPEAEFVDEEILPFVPKQRVGEVVVIDPRDANRPVPFNPLRFAPGDDFDLKAGELITILQRLCDDGSSPAPRMATILAAAVYALGQIPGSTLSDIERLLDTHDHSFRASVVSRLTDERTRRFWSEVYPGYPSGAHLSLTTRLERFLRSRFVRNVLCNPDASFNIREGMDTRKIILIPLSDGLLGPAADTLAQIFSSAFQLAAMSRADTPAQDRVAHYLYIDEFARVAGTSTTSFEQVFTRARKYSLGLVVGFQHLGLLDKDLARDLLGNVGTIIAFRCGAADARRLSRELVGKINGELVSVDPRELVSLPVGRAICKIGRTLLRLQTLPPPSDGDPSIRAEVLRCSRERYGVAANTGSPQSPRRARVLPDNPGEVL